ncbi:MAG: site-specific DNA-methyltransferase [Porphyromonas sp.]|uniref:site-specific DNA-methyltransferase n=1 Tax=Porphyromonas sp. TaxID=1924944 RepID=UPI001A442B56|nr:site-specific DNA-methyltransferase [Porphyromonas sp.]MBL6452836.1 site-specific DNA-methyltransferase [Porphyromonas sp.]
MPQRLTPLSPDGSELTIEALRQIAPSCITEVKDPQSGAIRQVVNFDVLRTLLGDQSVEAGTEMYSFIWPGKQAARREAATPITDTLRPVLEDSVDWDSTENLYIEGDNLSVLKLLQRSYVGKIKMIYIDPPYNTGNDFIYNDDYTIDRDTWARQSGERDEEGNQYRKNPDTNGRFHSDWCSMIYSRLLLSRSLLTDDGVIFISIDDNEVHNLRKICDEVFGASNFVAQMVWERAYAPKNDAKYVSNSHDYVLMYARQIGSFKIGRLPRTAEANARYSNPDNDPRGVWKASDLSVKTYTPENDYVITTPSGRRVEPPAGRCWSLSSKAFEERLRQDRIWFGPDGNSVPAIKRFLSELKYDGMAPTSILFHKEVGHSQSATQALNKLMEGGYFDGPKPLGLLRRLLRMANLDPDSIVLDFFSGSGTTAHAVMQLNAEDGGHRKFICVQLAEDTPEDSEARKAGYKTIPDIAKERIRRAAVAIRNDLENEKVRAQAKFAKVAMGEDVDKDPELWDNLYDDVERNQAQERLDSIDKRKESLDTGFRVFRLDSSNFTDVKRTPASYEQTELDQYQTNIKTDRSGQDLLYGAMLSWGLSLSLPQAVTVVDGCEIYNVDEGALVACFDKAIPTTVIEAIADMDPLRVLLSDSSFASDKEKINTFELLKQRLNWDDREALDKVRVL